MAILKIKGKVVIDTKKGINRVSELNKKEDKKDKKEK